MKILTLTSKLKALDKHSDEKEKLVSLALSNGVYLTRVIANSKEGRFETEHYSGRANIEYNGVRYLALGHRGSMKKCKDGYILFVVEPLRTRAPTLD